MNTIEKLIHNLPATSKELARKIFMYPYTDAEGRTWLNEHEYVDMDEEPYYEGEE